MSSSDMKKMVSELISAGVLQVRRSFRWLEGY